MLEVDYQIKETLRNQIEALEQHFEADCVFFFGAIYPSVEKRVRDLVEATKKDSIAKNRPKDRLVVFLNSPGGSAETVEKVVEIIRFNYKELFFVVPDEAMSAGTILCMAGDKIFMDYTSSLGPIDPQVFNGKDWVPALGYLDQVEAMIKKSNDGKLTEAELVILQNQDLAMLSRYEQAKNLTITLLKKWLVEYKFKDWKTHQTTPAKLGQEVTRAEKEERAADIATMLSNNRVWHSHGRMIGVQTLTTVLKLKIEDYSTDQPLRDKVTAYNGLITDYIRSRNYPSFFHSRCHF